MGRPRESNSVPASRCKVHLVLGHSSPPVWRGEATCDGVDRVSASWRTIGGSRGWVGAGSALCQLADTFIIDLSTQ
jgi:hypothetical protein